MLLRLCGGSRLGMNSYYTGLQWIGVRLRLWQVLVLR